VIIATEAETDLQSAPSRRHPGRTILVATVGVVIAAILAGGLITFVVGSAMRHDLIRGRARLIAGRDALVAGTLEQAIADFEQAGDRFDAAGDRARAWPAAFTARMPVLGRTIDVLRSLADAASTSAATGIGIARGLQELPGGIDALISPDGSVSVNDIKALGRLLENARRGTVKALRTVESSPSGLVPGPVSRARTEAIDEIQGSRDLVRAARILTGAFPSLAGVTNPRRYLFFAENPAELRGTGGLWGAFALVDARDGRFSVSRFRPVQALPNLPPRTVPVPFPEYRRNYGEYGAPGYWVNVNMTPDFPSAARAALAAWEATGRPPLDGVITADPFALRELLLVTGPVRSQLRGIIVTSDDVVPFLTNEAFGRFTDPAQRKVILGEAARAVVERFLVMDEGAMARLRAIVTSVSDGHLKIYASDPTAQAALALSGVDAGMHANGGDLAAVIVNAGAGGKIDYFSTRTIRHDVELVPGGGSRTTTAVTIENDAPTTGQPRYVIGPFVGRAGDNIPLVAVYCGRGCRLIRAERDGQPVKLGAGEELGLRFFRDYFTIPSRHERTLTVTTDVPRAWDDAGSHGMYRLTFVGQTTIRPTHALIRVHAPTGMRFTDGPDEVTLAGDVATWRGVLGDRLQLDLTLEKEPLLVRAWQSITGTAARSR
jgi:uncharacterized protein DUF4012